MNVFRTPPTRLYLATLGMTVAVFLILHPSSFYLWRSRLRMLPTIVLVVLLACGRPEATDPGPRDATAPPPDTGTVVEVPAVETIAPVPEPEQEIFIDGVVVANPVVVSGRARTFENNVVVRLRDARGALITEGFTTSEGEMGHHNPYRATLWVTRDPGVRISVEALEYSARDGSERSIVFAAWPFAVPSIDARLYFPDETCTAVKPYSRRLPKSVSLARLLVEALITGPLAAERAFGAAAPFSRGSGVRSVNLRDGTLTVDFNERLQNVGGACAARMIRESVTRTLGALPSVKKVVITAGGSESLALQP